ncbi:methyltransferase domain-containing protein [uncultured Draconibacterium sp.]|uniref:class I SAM-dependent methyltransferase n=1 Tax=uncultured Draconibacterium sp. TaxID=1573823 RepID=UPI0025D5A72D|nr:methyltransferase domain-containing protein [uncultured Draconibacterium sp.]
MKLNKLLANIQKPNLYEPGTAVMWTDEHISKQLLQVHLNENVDLASRKPETIKNTVDWILENSGGEKLNILDLGCGPGLYSTMLAEKGHNVTGVDFSKNSIEFAKKKAKEDGHEINYLQANYLELELPEQSFDLVLLIYTDLGVLLPEDRIRLLRFIHNVLKHGGTFIFDVLNDKQLPKKVAPKNWEVAESGFWKQEPYLALSQSFLYEKEKVILYQHQIVDENKSVDLYRFWTHFFAHSGLKKLLAENEWENVDFYKDVLPGGDLFSGEHVTFTVARKKK